MKKATLSLLTSCFISLSASTALAQNQDLQCGCTEGMTLDTLSQITQGMFVGKVVASEHRDASNFVSTNLNAQTVFKVEKIFYGDFSGEYLKRDLVQIRHFEHEENSCSLSFRKGKKYVIVTDREPTGGLITTYCLSGTELTSDAREIDKYFKENPVPAQ